MTYEIIDKPTNMVPWGRWQTLFNNLPLNKAALFKFDTKVKARAQAMSIQGCFRSARAGNYKLHYRVIPEGQSFLLYVWKEQGQSTNTM